MALILEIKVVTTSGRSKITLDTTGAIKCYVKAAPEHGKANKEVIKLFADFFHISTHGIAIMSGLTTTRKRLKIATLLTLEEVKHKILALGEST